MTAVGCTQASRRSQSPTHRGAVPSSSLHARSCHSCRGADDSGCRGPCTYSHTFREAFRYRTCHSDCSTSLGHSPRSGSRSHRPGLYKPSLNTQGQQHSQTRSFHRWSRILHTPFRSSPGDWAYTQSSPHSGQIQCKARSIHPCSPRPCTPYRRTNPSPTPCSTLRTRACTPPGSTSAHHRNRKSWCKPHQTPKDGSQRPLRRTTNRHRSLSFPCTASTSPNSRKYRLCTGCRRCSRTRPRSLASGSGPPRNLAKPKGITPKTLRTRRSFIAEPSKIRWDTKRIFTAGGLTLVTAPTRGPQPGPGIAGSGHHRP